MTTDFLFEEDLADSQRPLLRALKNLPRHARDMMNAQRVREGLNDVLALLNYERSDAPVRAELPADVDGRVVAGRNGFDIVHLHLPRLRASVERPAVERVVRQHPNCMVVATSGEVADEGAWHFINVKDAGQGRKVLRRAVVEPAFVGRTVLDTLSQCRVDAGESALDIQIAHERAFDVEAVSKRFYKEYAVEFERLRDELVDIHGAERERADGAVQELLNRLVFLMFIQRKGWLPTPENPDRNILWTEFSESHREQPDEDSYHREFLHPLFVALSRRKQSQARRGLPAGVRQVPFLNGGLFDLEDAEDLLTLPNSAFERVFRRLLLRYNFTVREDTPLEVEVAIDPEMLGRVFENLILQIEKTGELDPRKATGSYYTPRPVVHFMCQQALKEWIAGQDVVGQDAIDLLFELLRSELAGPDQRARLAKLLSARDAERLRERLLDIAVVDPAVGSGAFLVGMLHELLGLVRLLDLVLKGTDEIDRRNYDYEIKQRIIQRCLYGVDIQPRAVRICELRLWLSYAVDYELASGEQPPTLPNLDYRVVAGDSLIEHLLGHEVRWAGEPANDRERQLVDTIQEEKATHFLTDDPQPKHALELSILRHTAELAKEILAHRDRETQAELGAEVKVSTGADPLLAEIGDFLQHAERLARRQRLRAEDVAGLRRQMGPTFVWRLDFAEVFRRKGGFDIVIANPPYVFGENLADFDRQYIHRTYTVSQGQWDGYWLFYERGLRNLARTGGIHCFITSDALIARDEPRVVRELILQTSRILCLSHVGTIFDAGVSAVVLLCRKEAPTQDYPVLVYEYDGNAFQTPHEINVSAFYRDHKRRFITDTVAADLVSRLRGANPDHLSGYVRFSRGEELGKKNLQRLVEPVPKGWTPILAGEAVRSLAPPSPRHMIESALIRKDLSLYRAPKILVIKTGRRLVATVEQDGLPTLQSLYNLHVTDDRLDLLYLVALLNSSVLNYLMVAEVTTHKGLFPQINLSHLKELPLVVAPASKQQEVAAHAKKLMALRSKHNAEEAMQREVDIIDALIAELYGLSSDELKEIRQQLASSPP